MQPESVLASLRSELSFTPELSTWLLAQAGDEWFANDDQFLAEFSGSWRNIFGEVSRPIVDDYFASLGLKGELRPEIRIGDSYRGSFVLEAYLVLTTGIPNAYRLLKALSELPAIADGLEKLKDRISQEYQSRSNDVARERLHEAFRQAQGRLHQRPGAATPAPMPTSIVRANVSIDARPLLALRPEEPVDHRVHLAVAVTHDSLSVENLGEEPMRTVRIGLFESATERKQWSYADAFVSVVNVLSARQTISKSMTDFKHASGAAFSVQSDVQRHVDCWIQDEHGIYLFNFVFRPSA